MKPFATARNAAEIFFPQRVRLQLHQHGFSPVALDKMVSTNAEVKSGGVAVKILRKLTSISVSPIAVDAIDRDDRHGTERNPRSTSG